MVMKVPILTPGEVTLFSCCNYQIIIYNSNNAPSTTQSILNLLIKTLNHLQSSNN